VTINIVRLCFIVTLVLSARTDLVAAIGEPGSCHEFFLKKGDGVPMCGHHGELNDVIAGESPRWNG
jgi:hypothetical protein